MLMAVHRPNERTLDPQ